MTVDNPFYFGENEILLLLLPSQSMIIGIDRHIHTYTKTRIQCLMFITNE